MTETAGMMTYDEFRKKYLREHPSSIPQKPKVALTPLWLKLAILVAFLAAAIISGAHTVPAIAKTIPVAADTLVNSVSTLQVVAGLGFAMVELVMFICAYMLVLQPERRRLLLTLLGIVLAIAISGNLYSTFHALSALQALDLFTITLGVCLGIGAPLTAFLTGELFAGLKIKDDSLVAAAMREYRDLHKQLDTNILGAFKKYEREQTDARQTADRQAAVSAPVLSVQTDIRQTQQTGYGYNRTSDGQKRVVDYLSAHPEDAPLPLRTLADKIGVNKDTVSAGRKAWQQQLAQPTFSTNGHPEE